MSKSYGIELILDLHECDTDMFTRASLSAYFKGICKEIDMEPCDMHFWDDLETPKGEEQTNPHTKGTSAIQFILTSNITVHTLDLLKKVFVNIFSCEEFDTSRARWFTQQWFGGKVRKAEVITRL